MRIPFYITTHVPRAITDSGDLSCDSFYPIFPSPPPSKMLDPLNLDITHYDLVKMGSDGPDIVITPSIQKHFTRVSVFSVRLKCSATEVN